MKNIINSKSFFVLILMSINTLISQEIVGKWDLDVEMDKGILPSWLEVKKSGTKALVGYFVAHNGSARPISEVFFHNGIIDFSIPPQFDGLNDLHFQGILKQGKLSGVILDSQGGVNKFSGVRAPKLIRSMDVNWGKSISLFNGYNLDGWKSSDPEKKNQWTVKKGVLLNPESGVNLITDKKFEDFKLSIEFRYPKGSNSGVYLRGRYEVQVEDNYGLEPESTLFGGIYGFLKPNQMAAKPAGEWQRYEITLIGRRVSVVANDKKIINDQIIPGITGGALDSKEALPGPIMLQGDHGIIEYRNIKIQLPY
ncbi:MAG: DUF1080 domain-containing protein [Bacteroidota bacterium]|nr:DUF1080 domain-containing protein [Bacteroidota bacterium]MEC8599886.1 DUF1080 domain-containing protein [Bacteroidota bacterium]